MDGKELLQRARELIMEIHDIPGDKYRRWIDGRAEDLTGLSIAILKAMQETNAAEFDLKELRMQAASIPLVVAYMLGRQDATKRFSRVLRALAGYIPNSDQGERIDNLISHALRHYGWPEGKKPDLHLDDLIQVAAAVRRKGGDDLDYILRDLH